MKLLNSAHNLLLLSLLQIAALSAQAQGWRHITEYLDGLQERNPVFLSSGWQREVGRREQSAAWAALLPSITFTANSDYNLNLPVQLIPASIFGGPEGQFREARFGRDWNSAMGYQAELPLLHADKWAAVKVAAAARVQSQEEQREQVRQTMMRGIQLYFGLLFQEESLRLNQSLDSAAHMLYLTTGERYRQKLASTLEKNRAENLWRSFRQQVRSTEATLAITRKQLLVLAGRDTSSGTIVLDSLGAYLLAGNSLPPTLPTNPALLAATSAESAAFWRWKQQQRSIWPKLSLTSRYNWAEQADAPLSAGANRFNFGTVGLSLNIPLFRGGQNFFFNQKLRAQYELAKLKRESQALTANLEVAEWRTRLSEKMDNRQDAWKRSQLMSKSVEMALAAYGEGVMTLDQVFAVYQEYAQARQAALQTTADAALYAWYFQVYTFQSLK